MKGAGCSWRRNKPGFSCSRNLPSALELLSLMSAHTWFFRVSNQTAISVPSQMFSPCGELDSRWFCPKVEETSPTELLEVLNPGQDLGCSCVGPLRTAESCELG